MNTAAFSKLKNDPVISAVFDAADTIGAKSYLVGGALRNLVLSRPFGFDYDIALDGKIKDIANLLGERFKGSPFLLDKESDAYRVVIKGARGKGQGSLGQLNIDLSPFKGKDILEDLKNRDFTVNAMAVDIAALFREKNTSLIDIFNGQRDAKNKTIRMIKPEIFDDDPLRLLRAIRLSAQYGLIIDKETERHIKEKSGLLAKSSWERIRDDFFAILEMAESVSYVKRLYELSLLQKIIPEIKGWGILAGYNLLRHAFKTLEQGEKLYNNLKAFVPEFAGNIENSFQMPVGSVSKKRLFKLALFIHDAGKPATMKQACPVMSLNGKDKRIRFIGHETEGETIGKKIARRLKLSRAAVAFIARLVGTHHRVFNLASLERVTDRSKAHLFRATGGEDGIALALLSLADARATRNGDGPELALFVKNLISFYYKIYAVSKPNPILNGNEVMEIFGLSEGIMVGRILKKLAEAEGEGVIKNKKDAVKFIKNWLAKSKEG